MSECPHLKGHVDCYVSNLVDVWQRPSVVLTPAGSQLQVLSLLELQLQTQQGGMRGGDSGQQHRINEKQHLLHDGLEGPLCGCFSVDTRHS